MKYTVKTAKNTGAEMSYNSWEEALSYANTLEIAYGKFCCYIECN